MRLTRSVSYGLGVLMRVGEAGKGETMTALRISEGGDYPPRFLYRVLRRLVDSGLLRGVSGPGGGYRLARPAAQISLLDIVRAVDGDPTPDQLEAAVKGHKKAIERVNAVSKKTNEFFVKQLKALKLARLMVK